MNTKLISFAAIAIVAVLAGCTKNPIETPSDSNRFADLELTSVNSVQTKAAIDGTTFPTDGEIGLFLFKDETATQAYGDGYENIKYTYNSTKEKWTASPSIKVGSTPGYLYGYYPYDSEATDVKAIPVESSLNGDDVMYASKQAEPITDATAANTTITMNHALARVSITVKNNGYTGAAKLTSIKFADAKIAPEGTLNALDGTISATKTDDVTLDVPTASQDITATGTTYDCLLVPSAEDESKQTVTLTLTIDGVDKTATLSGDNGVIFAQGTKSNITITLSDSGISVQTVSVDDWKIVEVGGHKVTVKLADVGGIEKDIWVMTYAEGKSAIIKAHTESGRPIECVLPDDKLCEYTKNNNIYTFTISDIASDLIATVGYVTAQSISLNKDELNLIEKYGHFRLVATFLPEETVDKALMWSSSDESVATVDQNGFVKAFAKGSATITAETKVGGRTATCAVTVVEPQSRPDGTLPGHFSVSDSTAVYFSKGNLYCSGVSFNDDGTVKSIESATWGFEEHQYDTAPSADGNRDTNHISHFMWCSTAEKSMSLVYNSDWNGESPFFAEKDFSVGGVNIWSTLTEVEWRYLLFYRTMNNDGPRYTNRTIIIEGTNYYGLFIYPDDYNGMVVGDAAEIWTWEKINYAGIVFLPAAGYRDDDVADDGSICSVCADGYYWSASSLIDWSATSLNFYDNIVDPHYSDFRDQAYSVRLVTEVK